MEYFWKKKTTVSFILSILVFWIHIASFSQYLLTSKESGVARTIVQYSDCFLTDTFSRVAVPLFFILAGVTFFRDYDNGKYKSKIYSRIWSLLIPYLLWNTIGMLFEIATSYSFVSKYFLSREKFVVSPTNILKGIFFYECNGPFWFICTLIIFVILSPFFDLLAKKKITAIISVIVFIAISPFEIPIVSTLLHKTYSLAYYMAGCTIGRYYLKQFTGEKDIDGSGKQRSVISLGVFLFCTVLWFIRSIGVFRMPTIFNISFLIIYALSFWFAADILFNIRKMDAKDFLDDSFFIYAMHINVSAIIVKLLYLVLPKRVIIAIPNFLLTTLLTLTVILLFAKVLRDKLPKVYSVLSGKRVKKKF